MFTIYLHFFVYAFLRVVSFEFLHALPRRDRSGRAIAPGGDIRAAHRAEISRLSSQKIKKMNFL